jgi:acetyltransferase-like isoleucine patch superfamily enzyme
MTEKEKMLVGKPYKWDKEIIEDFNFTQELLFDFNTLRPNEIDKRIIIINKIFGKTGNKFNIRPPFYCNYGYNIFIGEDFFANYNLHIIDAAKVTIGDNVLFGPYVRLFAAGHPVHYKFREFVFAFPIVIGNNVWIGGGAIVNPGITIGDNTVIGSGSVVTKNIPANVIAAGNPCRVIREITDDDRQYYFNTLKSEEKPLALL